MLGTQLIILKTGKYLSSLSYTWSLSLDKQTEEIKFLFTQVLQLIN